MKNPRLLLLLSAVGVALAASAKADLDLSISADIRLGKAAPPPPPPVVVVEETAPAGPPPWAPAHGFRRNHSYYYYPSAEVYYRTDNHLWFYLERGSWRSAPALPPDIRIDFSRSVSLTMETDRPYQFHRKVVAYYPANYFGTRVRLKDEPPGHREKFDRGEDDDPGHDRGNGNGNGHGRGKGKK